MPSCAISCSTASARLVARADRRPAGPQEGRDRDQLREHLPLHLRQIRRTNDGSWRHYLPRAKGKRGWRGRPGDPPVNLIKGRVSIACDRPRSSPRTSDIGKPISCSSPPPANRPGRLRAQTRAFLSARQPGKAAQPRRPAPARSLRTIDPRLRQPSPSTTAPSSPSTRLLDQLGIQTFFCDPHSPWQKGAIENAIGRCVASCLAKPTSTSTTTLNAHRHHNNTPRKCCQPAKPPVHFKSSLRSG